AEPPTSKVQCLQRQQSNHSLHRQQTWLLIADRLKRRSPPSLLELGTSRRCRRSVCCSAETSQPHPSASDRCSRPEVPCLLPEIDGSESFHARFPHPANPGAACDNRRIAAAAAD